MAVFPGGRRARLDYLVAEAAAAGYSPAKLRTRFAEAVFRWCYNSLGVLLIEGRGIVLIEGRGIVARAAVESRLVAGARRLSTGSC